MTRHGEQVRLEVGGGVALDARPAELSTVRIDMTRDAAVLLPARIARREIRGLY